MTPKDFELRFEKAPSRWNYIWAFLYSLIGLWFVLAILLPTYPWMEAYGFWELTGFKLLMMIPGSLALWIGVTGFKKIPGLRKIRTIRHLNDPELSWSRFRTFCKERKLKLEEHKENYAFARGQTTNLELSILIEKDRVLYKLRNPGGQSLEWFDLGALARMHRRFVKHMTAEDASTTA